MRYLLLNRSIQIVVGIAALLGLGITVPPEDHASHENCFIIEGMHVEWTYEGHLLTFKLRSPYQGWLALGFNSNNTLPGSHRVNGQVVSSGPDLAEQYVLGFGDARPLTALGAQNSVVDYHGDEDESGTSFEFTIDTSIRDEFHHDLRQGQRIWLICAYGLSDDFSTPSIMQRHVEVEL
ncbi:MAG: hypothetical protein D6772_04590 [Bacteroidetes bacterium]|nr:MAG: hypothetical protein D6772_04590 [Bacteroidota bacterium]